MTAADPFSGGGVLLDRTLTFYTKIFREMSSLDVMT
jgi:hypothetical protein